MSLPLNRVIAFAGPYIGLIAAGFVAWLVAKANVATHASGSLTFTNLPDDEVQSADQPEGLGPVATADILGLENIDEANAATPFAGAVTFTFVTALSSLAQSKWLSSDHVVIRSGRQLAASALLPLASPTEAPEVVPGGTPDALRPLMPSESPLQGEPDEVDEP